jgi:hypothetical protein
MKNFFKRNWGKILLAIILLTVSFLSFKYGYSYLSNDNYSPDLNPLLTIQRSIQSPAWRSYRVLGFASESEQADVFRSGLYYILDLFLPTWSLSQIFALLCLFVGSWFTGLLGSSLIKDTKKKKYSELVFLLGGIFYISTLWTVWVYYQNMFPYITQFGLLPLVIWSIYRLIKDFNWKNALLLFFSTILFTSTFIIATLFVVDIVVIFIFTLIFALTYSKGFKDILKKTFLTILLFIFTQLFWILPFIHYTVNVSGDIVASHTNQTVTTSIIDLEKEAMDSLNSARMYTRVLETTDDQAGDKYLFEDAEEYLTYDFFKFVALIPAIFAVLAIVFGVIKKKKTFIFIGIVAFCTWFIIKNQNPPLGVIYTFLQENIPLFKQVFRWPSSKLGQVYIYSLSLLAPIGFAYLMDFLASFLKKKWPKVLLLTVTTGLLLSMLYLFSGYMFEGKLFVERAIVQVPQQYYELGDYLEENDQAGRILYLPTSNNGYFREYDWGFIGSGFLHYIVPNPLMDMSLSIGSDVGEDAMWKLRNIELSHDIEAMEEYVRQYEVEYILIDKNLVKGRYGYEIDWTTTELLTQEFEMVWSDVDSDIVLYKTGYPNGELIESLSKANGTFFLGDSVSPTLNPLNLGVSNWDIVGNSLESEFTYSGTDVELSLDSADLNLEKFPSKGVLKDDLIVISPAIPTVDGIGVNIQKISQTDNYDFYIADNRIFTKQQLLDGVAVDIPYYDLDTVYGVYDNNWSAETLTSYLANNGKSGNCSGIEFEEDINVELQGLASGFSISGDSELPCIYSHITLPTNGIVKISFNWEEVTPDTYIGYCLYSQEYERCINEEKYIYSNDQFGQEEILLPLELNKNDDLTLTIYTYSPTQDSVEAIFRNIQIQTNDQIESLSVSESVQEEIVDKLILEDGKTYTIQIPIIYGDNSYIYRSSEKENLIWQINESQTNGLFEGAWNNGIQQIVQDQYLNQYTTLFETTALDKYLWYWSGENISNIPATLCLTYENDDKCWVDDIFLDNQESTALEFFTTLGDKRIDLSYRSVSYSNLTENILYDFIIMHYPEQWQDVSYIPSEVNTKTQVEATTLGNSLSMIYSYLEQSSDSILTIPQASESGWIAISIKDNIPQILKSKVLVNGWKQGWDISNLEYDEIYVIYYPNLLAYLGYIFLIIIFLIIIINLIKRRNAR